MRNDFYRQLEDRFRSSRATIKARLSFYGGFLDALRTNVASREALDLGCGRGEWLEILQETGFTARGVDLDEGMLDECRILGLPATRGDALDALRVSQNDSLALISAFHVVEHLSFDLLLEIIKEAYRALAPGGLLILETPNPENLAVGTSSFFLDPTHSKPIPHALLAFVVEYSGFEARKILRLNENNQLYDQQTYGLSDVIHGASPDYAVVGIKAPAESQLVAYEALLETDYGLALETLATRYDTNNPTSLRIANLETALGLIDDRLFAFSCKLDDTYDLAQPSEQLNQLNLLLHTLQSEIEKTHQIQRGLVTQIDDMRNSNSWRITRPVRAVGRIVRSVKSHGLKGFMLPFIDYVKASPQRKATIAKWCRRMGLRRSAQRLLDSEVKE